jgi:hypothetical protein
MMPDIVIELVYFTGCPHVERARGSLRHALRAAGLPEQWQEWNQFDPSSPERIQGYASPTILIAGRDVNGTATATLAKACRIDGLASPETIRTVLLDEVVRNADRRSP